MSLAAHFGDGSLGAEDLASGLLGAVIKDPVYRIASFGRRISKPS
jgi:hypothetical protein